MHCVGEAGQQAEDRGRLLAETIGTDLAEGTVMDNNAVHTETSAAKRAYGRPKGTTMVHSRDLKERLRLATAEAAEEYRIVRETAKMRNRRAERGMLSSIVAAAKYKY